MKRGMNIYKRKDGRWEGRYKKAKSPDGKIRYGYCYGKTYSEVKKKLLEKETYKVTETKDTADLPFSSILQEWMLSCRASLKPSTLQKYKNSVDKYILPFFGSYTLNAITTDAMQKMVEWMKTEQKSSATIRNTLVILHLILKYAMTSDPNYRMPHVPYPRMERKEMRVLSIEEQEILEKELRNSSHPFALGILISLHTGLRIGEVCALQYGDVSPVSRTLLVRHTVQRLQIPGPDGQTRLVPGSPKSSTSLRMIPISDELFPYLISKEDTAADSYVLTETDKIPDPRKLQYTLSRICKNCDLQNVHFHTLRHTFATRCIETGCDAHTLSELLGHSDTSITMNKYVHSSLSRKRTIIENMRSKKQ